MSSTSSEDEAVHGGPEYAAHGQRAPRELYAVERATDDQLCKLIEERNPCAAYELLRRYSSCAILPEALRVLGDRADAEEVRSDLLVKLLRGPIDLAWEWPPSNVRDWLRTVTFRLALDLKRNRDSEMSRRAKQSEWLPSRRLPDDVAVHHELRENLGAAVRNLPVEERQVVECLFVKDLPIRDACEELRVPRRTLFRRRAAALARLKSDIRLKGYADP